MKVIGLTGSIAMGKSTVAGMLAAMGIPVFDSDAAVHALYAYGGAAVAPIAALVPEAITQGAVDRSRLSQALRANPSLYPRLEAIVHPLVRAAQDKFIRQAREGGAEFAALDVPLLFETGRDKDVDVTLLVSAPPEIQKVRALARPGMTPEKFDELLARQMPDAAKRARADFVVENAGTVEDTEARLRQILDQIRKG